jgi:glutamine cyclotransferase
MKFRGLRYIMSFTVILIITWTLSCSGRSGKPVSGEKVTAGIEKPEPAPALFRIVDPGENSEFRLHQDVKVVLEKADKERIPDSIALYFDGKLITVLGQNSWEYTIPGTLASTTGRKSLKVTAFSNGKTRNSVTRFIIVYSDTPPARFGYRVVNTYPHDRDAFTQGLFYDNGVLFEGTGQQSGSSLREVELTTGVIRRQHNLDSELFGEGITLYDNRIYQVTWQNKVGFVYDRTTFNLIKKLYYNTEGWGLTTVNNRIVMSDGSNILYFFDPEMFTVISRLEVYDNERMVDQLNELEYIDGEIWANIWQTDLIARIDPVSGKINSYINLSGILKESDRTPETDVLNGIAWDRNGKRIFVTGKKWPKLFEISIVK